ncbi:hypothetical protein [Kitasatospora aureofaciens]|uniref:hypothetical protein n=1 Tax=Kitasatospora aureofaciens TaxID=1894 RepID=UPI0005264B29|nr:hypothetical protein [Kitasatospora aureofaciens]
MAAAALGVDQATCERWYRELADLDLVRPLGLAGAAYRTVPSLAPSPSAYLAADGPVERAIGWLGRSALAAVADAGPFSTGATVASDTRPEPAATFATVCEALVWLEVREPDLRAALEHPVVRCPRARWRLALAVCHVRQERYDLGLDGVEAHRWLATAEAGLADARADGGHRAVRLLQLARAAALRAAGRPGEARDQARLVLDGAARHVQGRAWYEIALASLALGQADDALLAARTATRRLTAGADERAAGPAMALQGRIAALLGETDLAHTYLERAQHLLSSAGHEGRARQSGERLLRLGPAFAAKAQVLDAVSASSPRSGATAA